MTAPSPREGATLLLGITLALVVVPVIFGDGLSLGTFVGAVAGVAFVWLLSTFDGAIHKRTAGAGGVFVAVVLVAIALWLH